MEITWDMIIDLLKTNEINVHRFEVNNDAEVLCRTEDDANCIADFLEALLGYNDLHTSSYGGDDEWIDGFRWRVYPD